MGIPGGFGSTLVCGSVSAMLYGTMTLQGTYVYYMHYSEDVSAMKFLVATLWVLDTLHVSFMSHMLYHYLIINYGVPTTLEYIVWSFPASLLVNLFVTCVVHFFFAHVIYCLCRRQAKRLVVVPILSPFACDRKMPCSDRVATDPGSASSLRWVFIELERHL
ncbi:hypothetical protein F5J12DRAFT_95488 [Pisolithus orientalis]|uniref:uncharacterized protein n=1 Tax=Pisolithus orientalis TaxID=936130 RepID=UPI00222438AB|nr:uncharacterized protein F5J12DRAFT_95488 [Pisolithus orientalis]KAI6006494.1 hypothetical protein F5J12DRAFT_95488 [Pisolithus orientalis]